MKCSLKWTFELQYDEMTPINALEAKVLDRREIQVNHEKNLYPRRIFSFQTQFISFRHNGYKK